jgi:hypothetical protein
LTLSDSVFHPIFEKLGRAVQENDLDLQLRSIPGEAFRFLIYVLGYSDEANRQGRHSISMALLRQCVEAIAIMELGLVRHADRSNQLMRWRERSATAGDIRGWLEKHVWVDYGNGLWDENWTQYMRQFARAVQPYAHFSPDLILWQERFLGFDEHGVGFVVQGNDAYDPQKASRITLFHAILHFTLGRLLAENSEKSDTRFRSMVSELGDALAKSKYLDGHQTNWEYVFMAMMWGKDGSTVLE